MSSFLYNQEPVALVHYMGSYFDTEPRTIALYSEDKFEIPVHKEVFTKPILCVQCFWMMNFVYSEEKWLSNLNSMKLIILWCFLE